MSSIEQLVLECASLGAWVWDVAADRVECSDLAHAIFGVTRAEAGAHLADFLGLIHPRDRPRVQAQLERVLASGRDWEITFGLASDAERCIRGRGAVLRDASGRAVRIAGVVEDTTGAHQRQREQRTRTALMQKALDASLFAVTVLDPHGQIIYCNELAASLLGLTRSTAEQRAYDAPQFKHTDVYGGPWPDEKQPFVRVMATGEAVSGIEHRIERPDGRNIVLRINGAPVKNERGEIELLVFSYEDITERRAIEEGFRQAQKLEAIGRLAGGVAHDFNNLLTAIMSFAALARDEVGDTQRVLDDLAGIEEASERAAQLTRQLLTFSRQQIAQPVSFDARDEARVTLRLIERVLGEDVALELQLGAEPCWVRMDRNQLQQVLLNLAVNARDAMPEGGRLAISVAQSGAGEVLITVRDTGCGMDAATLRRVFEPFFRTKDAERGTGLGLSTSHGIISQAGGRIALFSELGRGTCAELRLPLAQPPEARVSVPPVARARSMTARILLVEDDLTVQRVALRALEREGYAVRAAASGTQALNLLEVAPCDLLICDLVLPGMGGAELLQRVRETHPDVRVLFVSGYSRELASIGHHPLLAKPYTPELLAARVAEILSQEAASR